MKKPLLIFLFSVLVICISVQNTKAFSMSEALNNLSVVLDQLKDKLKAQIAPVPGYWTTPPGNLITPPMMVAPSMVSCTSDSNCEVRELITNPLNCCCGPTNEQRAWIAINKTSAASYLNLKTQYCSQINCPAVTCPDPVPPVNTAKCIHNICTISSSGTPSASSSTTTTTTTTTTTKPSAPVISSAMKKCNTVSDCITVETACCGCNNGGDDNTKSVINRLYYSSFASSLSSYCAKTNQKYCLMVYNCKVTPVLKCVNNLCTTSIIPGSTTTTTSTTSTSTTTTTTTKPTYQWFKGNVTVGDPKEKWYAAVVTCATKGSTKAKWDTCFKAYLANIQVVAKSIIVGEVGSSDCIAYGCEAPSISIETELKYKSQLEALGFITIEDPTIPVDTSIVNIDLATKGLFFARNKTTKLINYEVLNKLEITNCGDNICQSKEKYLYELDVAKNCSPIDETLINYKHCPSDCKEALNPSLAITEELFKTLKLKCTNAPKPVVEETPKLETKIPVPQKPINQMTTFEKQEFIKELQIVLIELLTTLLAMLRR